eukprot:TRINITY_DN9628_c0_g1_i1.p1 TRINITY_DN9628_c0_g1~~TRINITY_DN9628_c0_g1_i1.p1  ORF type:complete len:317 (+),score=108.78 TRINITY_DN9628_c0_g1_i1:95-952(+)
MDEFPAGSAQRRALQEEIGGAPSSRLTSSRGSNCSRRSAAPSLQPSAPRSERSSAAPHPPLSGRRSRPSGSGDAASLPSRRPPPPHKPLHGQLQSEDAEPLQKPIPPWRDLRRSDAGSQRTGSVSVTSSEAMRKLGQLEDLLERERRARRAAEDTLRQLVEQRKHRPVPQSEAAEAQAKLDQVMATLRVILGDDTTLEQLTRLRREQQRKARPQPPSGKSMIDELGADPDQCSNSRHRPTAARSGFTVDHCGGLHFKPQPRRPPAPAAAAAASGRPGLPPLAAAP